MLLEDFCAAIAAYTDMCEEGIISEKECNRTLKKFWRLAGKV